MFTGDPAKLGQWLDSTAAPVLAAQPEVPKVWVAAGNCLIGDAKHSTESMVVTALGSGGFRQFVGYVVPTWFGRAGWGTLGLWQGNRGALSLADAFHLNQQKIVDETMRRFPEAMAVNFDADDIESALRGADPEFGKGLERLQKEGVKVEKDLVGLVHDRDVTVLWGDPKWQAVFRPQGGRAVRCEWSDGADGSQVLRLRSDKDFEGEVAEFLPRRINQPRLKGPAEAVADTVVADDFVIFRKLKLSGGKPLELRVIPG
jgi:zinc protease